MEVVFLGHSSFRIKTRQGTIVTDPFDPGMVGLKFPKVTADIVTVSHQHNDHNQVSQILGSPKVVAGPGEYELAGISILGISSFHDQLNGRQRGENTIYTIAADDLRVCHLGDLGHKLSDEQISQLGPVNILLVPVGGEYTIDAKTAVEVVSQVEPNIVMPMHYQMPGLNPEVFGKLESVSDFIAEIGVEPRRQPRYSIGTKDLPEELTVVVLERKE